MIRLLLIGIVSSCALLCSAQGDYFNNLYFLPNEAQSATSQLIIDFDTLYTLGTTNYDFNQFLSIRTIEHDGTFVQQDLIDLSGFYPHFADAANKLITSDDYVYSIGLGDTGGIVRINHEPDTVWFSEFDIPFAVGESPQQAKEFDGYTWTGGRSGYDANNDGGFVFDHNALLLTKHDNEGNLLASWQFQLFVEDHGISGNMFFPLGNNEFLFTALHVYSGAPELGELDMVKVNIETNEVEYFEFSNPDLRSQYARALQKEDGRIIVCYGYTNSLLFNDYAHPDISVRVFEFDTETMLPAEEVIALPSFNDYARINDFTETPDGGYALCGETAIVEYTNPNDPNSVSFWETYGYIVKLDSLFQYEWSELYQYPDDTPDALGEFHQFDDLEITSDGGFAVVGTWMENFSGPQRTWVVKTDCKGKLELPQLSFSAEIVQSGDTVVGMSTGCGVWNYQWDYGNGNVSQNDTANFVFTQPGEYTVIASSSYCAMTIDSTFTIQILDCAGNTTTPSLAINPLYTQVDFTTEVQFTSMPENLIEVQWNFGGDWVVGNEQTWLFPSPGAFEVLVQGMYCDSVFTDTLNIVLTDCAGNIETPPLSLTPTNLALNDSAFVFDCTPDNLTNITWNFGDGAFSFGTNTEHTYLSTGEFEVVVCGEYCDSLFCDTLFVTATVGMHEQASQNHSFVIVPNPVIQNEFEIRGSTIIQSVRVMDLTGQVIVEQAAQSRNVKMFVPSLAVGTYILEVIHADGFIEYDKILVK